MRRTARTTTAGLLVLLLAGAGCTTPRAQIRHTADQGDIAGALRMYRAHVQERGAPNADALADVALVVLRRAATSSDARERNAGFAALRSLGPRAREVFEGLADRPGAVGDRSVAALFDLDGHEGPAPTRLLFATGTSDPERIVAGLVVLEVRRDIAGLIRALATEWPDVRRAAAQRLGRFRSDRDATHALAECTLHDHDDMVRAAYVSAIANHGPAGVDAIVHALDDPELVVKLVAIWSLAQAVPSEAHERLAPMLAPDQDPLLGLEAARALASHGDTDAVQYVLASLDSPREDLRAQAAVAASSLPERNLDQLAPHIEDADVEVRIRIAARFANRENFRTRVIRALRPVALRPDPIVAVRALQVLAEAGDPEAAGPLRGALGSQDANVRRVAVLAWSHLAGTSGETDPLAPLLEDSDRSIRLMAAAEIVRIAAR
jgi:HEAT repeat protein